MKKINKMFARGATILGFLLAALASGVEANQPPICESAYSKPDSIWPPNKAFKKIKIYGVTDPDGDNINVAVQCIRQDEPVVDSHDATGIGSDDPSLRRSRDDNGNGRVYYIEFLATDSHGAHCSGILHVQLPLTKDGNAIGDGPIYDSVPQQSGCAGSPINNPPSITSFPVVNATATLDYQYDVDATDPDGDVLIYRLVKSPEGMSIDSQSGLISWRPMESHSSGHEIEIEVADDEGETDTQLFLLTVSLAPNQPPLIISEPVVSGRAEQNYRYDVEASDEDQDLLVYHLDVFPVGMIIDDASGLITWTPDAAQAEDHEVIVRVEDVRGDSAVQSFTLNILPPNSTPVIISNPITEAIATQPYTYNVLGTDADADALVFSLSQAPVGMLIDASTGEISWVPDELQTGSHSVDILVEDSLGGHATQSYFISVAPKPNNPPSIVSQPITEVLVGTLYSYDVEAEDPDTDEALTFALSTAPAGMTVDPASGLIEWLPGYAVLGSHEVVVTVEDHGELSASQSFTLMVYRNNYSPVITSDPILKVNENSQYSYSVLASDPDGDPIAFNLAIAPTGMAVDSGTGVISWLPSSDDIGFHDISIVVSDSFGLMAEQHFSVEVIDVNEPPLITSNPIASAEINQAYQYQVQASDPDSDSVTFSFIVAPSGMAIGSSGLIQWIPQNAGVYDIGVQAMDGRGGSGTQYFSITVLEPNQAPAIVINQPGNGASYPQSSPISFSATATDDRDGDLSSDIQWSSDRDGELGTGSIITAALSLGDHVVTATAVDSSSLIAYSSVSLRVIEDVPHVDLPPDPETIAPDLSTTDSGSLLESVEFLYSATDPVQTGVDATSIDQDRVAVIRGKIIDRANNPISGVTVAVANYEKFGQTLSRETGLFDMAVNGGGRLVINYDKPGFLPVQRAVEVPWSNYVVVDDVVMMPLDSQVTTINLADSTKPFQVAQGSVQTDVDGSRQATILFPSGAIAEMVLADGTSQSLSTLSVRATEYTVGEKGRATMPGELPMHSAYTYAVEFSVDEAIEAGAESVNFDTSVPVYVDNFLEFRTGEHIPSAWYDRKRAAWIPSPDGRVIGIVAITNGKADLDIDGSGTAASALALSALGITDAERQQLAELYTVGKTLWRVPVDHFTPWDFNLPGGLPEDAISPPDEEPKDEDEDEPDPEDNNECEGCVIEAQRQVLGEEIPLIGSAESLTYRSDRVPGRKTSKVLHIPLSLGEVPDSLRGIDLTIQVAGQVFQQSFVAAPGLATTFEWDGKDAYGREIASAIASVTISYRYDWVYYAARNDLIASFGVLARPSTGSRPILIGDRTDAARIEKRWKKTLVNKIPDSAGLGSWSLRSHHQYDPLTKTLYMGDGDKRSASSVSAVVSTVAGNGSAYDGEDNIPATETGIYNLHDMEFGADGSLFLAGDTTVRRIRPDGIIETVAGNGVSGFSGDGGPAVNASIRPNGIAIAEDGTLYIADTSNHRIRKVNSEGIISTVAGTGAAGFNGDERPAVEANINLPFDVAIGPDASLYFLDSNNYRLRNIDADGVIHTVAGNGIFGTSATNVLATSTRVTPPNTLAFGPDGVLHFNGNDNSGIYQIDSDGILGKFNPTSSGGGGEGVHVSEAYIRSPREMAFGPDGSLYFAEYWTHRIRRVAPNGMVNTVVGTGNLWGSGSLIVEGGSPLREDLSYPRVIAVNQKGEMYYFHNRTNTIRKIASGFQNTSAEDIVVPSRSGQELYVFNSRGRHLKTIDATTGNVLLTFTYTEDGLLHAVTNLYNDVLTIERLSNGAPAAIVAPYGQRTELQINANGFLSQVTNPAGETHQMIYSDDGLMTRYTNPRNFSNTFVYDSLGRIIEDIAPNGGGWQLDRAKSEVGYTVPMTTGEGKAYSFTVTPLATGAREQVNVRPDGTQTHILFGVDGTETTTYADGTLVYREEGPDPRFGLLAPVPKVTRTTTPAGLTHTTTAQRSITLTDPTNLLSHTAINETLTVNGKVSHRRYDAATRTWTFTSPEGRTATAILNAQGRTVLTQVPGLAAVTYDYDSRGRLKVVTQGSGSSARTTSLTYDSNGYMSNLTDALDRIIGFERDEVGRVLSQALPGNRNVAFAYDSNGNTTGITPPERPEHSYTYSNMDILTIYTRPSLGEGNGIESYSYNRDKQLTALNYPSGETKLFNRDSAGRIESITETFGNIGYTYEPSTGRVSSIAAPLVTLGYSYDGFLKKMESWTGVVTGAVGYSYDNDFRVVSQTVNGTNPIAFAYDDDGLLTHAGSLTLNYDAQNGLLIGTATGSVNSEFSYNLFGELSGQTAAVSGNTVYSAVYTQNNLGWIVGKTEVIGSDSNVYEYAYDPAGRLGQVMRNGVVTESYTYDGNDNRLTAVVNGETVSAIVDNQDRLIQYGDISYTYDLNGAIRTKRVDGETTTYLYDPLRNLRQVDLSDGTHINYVIDGKNRRIGKEVNGTLTQAYLYQDQINPIAELDKDGNIVSRFVYGDKAHVPSLMIKEGITYRIVSDHLGSPRLVINSSNGTIIQRMDYDSYGRITNDTNPGFQPFGFAGGLYDQHIKLTRFGARDYDAESGRWLQVDPIGLRGGLNAYGYVSQNPLSYIDPYGLLSYDDARGQAMTGLLERQSSTGLEHSCYICQIPTPPGYPEDFNVGPLTPGSSESEVGYPEKCRVGDPVEAGHSHPDFPYLSDDDYKAAKDLGVPVFAIDPSGRWNAYDPKTKTPSAGQFSR